METSAVRQGVGSELRCVVFYCATTSLNQGPEEKTDAVVSAQIVVFAAASGKHKGRFLLALGTNLKSLTPSGTRWLGGKIGADRWMRKDRGLHSVMERYGYLPSCRKAMRELLSLRPRRGRKCDRRKGDDRSDDGCRRRGYLVRFTMERKLSLLGSLPVQLILCMQGQSGSL